MVAHELVQAKGNPEAGAGVARERTSTLLSVGSILAAIGASSCCVVPFALFGLGISGAWIGNLTALAPYQPIFVAATLALLAGGFGAIYRKPKVACADGSYCACPASSRIAKIGLWTATVLIAVALVFPYAIGLILET